MIEGLLPTHPGLFVDLQAFPNKVARKLRDFSGKCWLTTVNAIDELKFVGGGPGSPAVQHFVVDETNRPQVRLGSVLEALEDLGRHIERSANDGLHDGVVALQVLGESKVADLAYSIFEQYVGRLEVSVDDALGVEVLGSFHELLEVLLGLALGQLLLLLEVVIEVALLAKLGDDVHVVGGLVDVVQFDYVFVGDLLHDVDFRLDVLQVVGIHE